MRCSTYSSKPKRPCQRPTSRALAQSVMWTSWSGSSTRTVSRSSVAKWPLSGATSSTRGCGGAPSLAKRSSVPKGVASTSSSCTGSIRLPTLISSMPKGGRWWLSAPRLIISHSAATARQLSACDVPPCASAWLATLAQARIGSMTSVAVWYSA